jgi:hypothetical protein
VDSVPATACSNSSTSRLLDWSSATGKVLQLSTTEHLSAGKARAVCANDVWHLEKGQAVKIIVQDL